MPIHKKVNSDFFKKWSPEMAYVLGFFAADGTMIKNSRGGYYIEFHITDLQVLRQIRKALSSKHRIAVRKRSEEWKVGYRIQIGSKTVFEDLISLGFTPRKSSTLCFPRVPKEHLGSFIRGYFDGDGCVYFRKHNAKDRKNPRWVFQTRFTSGSVGFLTQLHSLLHNYGVNGGFILKKKRGFELVLSHRDGLALYHLMYNNSPRIYLIRKYKLFQKALTTLYGKEMRP